MLKMDAADRNEEILVKAKLPGIDKKDIDISITGNRLYVKAKTCHEEDELPCICLCETPISGKLGMENHYWLMLIKAYLSCSLLI